MFSSRINRLKPSLVREILNDAQAPGMISFAGGLPASETLYQPEQIKLPAGLWQYGSSEGEFRLRELIAARVCATGLPCRAEQVLITNGSQQGIDLVAKLMIDEGTPVLTESPTYLAALQVFDLLGARIDAPNGRISREAIAASPAKLAYLIPTFQNPTGYCYSAAERIALAGAFDQREMIVFEDDPYRDLAFDGPAPAPLSAHLQSARWIYQGSFSKTLAPGLRLGFLVMHPDLLAPITQLKQAADLHSNRISQGIVAGVLESGELESHIERILPVYLAKRDAMHDALLRHMADLASWQKPPGGLFFWLALNAPTDTLALMRTALGQGLAIMPGGPFYPRQDCAATLRLNFSHSRLEDIETGVALLARLLRQA